MSASNNIYAEAKTAVFWDIEDCKIPNGLDAIDVSHNIRRALANVGYHGTVSIKAYGDGTKAGSFSAEIELVHFPAEHKREKLKEILADFFVWAMDHREPSNLMLLVGDISEDTALLDAIQFLRSQNYNILLAQPQVATGVLLTIPSSAWLWESLSAGGKPIDQTTSSQSVDNTTSACSGSSQGVMPSPPTSERSGRARRKRQSKVRH
ncbi:hypothetical protein V5N11_027229 [Cardamine amara subsp. amara]|uniref:NYN domain-containing protein n=1 Tax=Cardamine amara subsp. amara TaxID=228776 RepID=A0ABD1AR17_CARAN